MIVANRVATVASLGSLAESAAKQFGKDESAMAHAVETGLVPFIELARNSPGQLYPSPIVLEILDFAQQFGAPEVKENLADLRLAEPASTDELVAAYTHTVETLRVAGVKVTDDVWPSALVYRAESDCCKYEGSQR